MLYYKDDVVLTHFENCVKSLGLSPRERKVGGIGMFFKKECTICPKSLDLKDYMHPLT